MGGKMDPLGTRRFGKILVAIDGSESAQRAADVAIELAQKYDAELTVLHVVETPAWPYASDKPIEIDVERVDEGAKGEEEKLVSRVASLAEIRGVKAGQKVVREVGSAVEGITEYAEKNGIDLIVVGTRGTGGFQKLVFGSVASGVVTYAKCSVTVVR
jgi:nucleotide-binding universal stress UspA family protein